MKTFYLLLLAAAITVTSCRTKEGEPGPAGESTLYKQGSVAGSLAYVDNNGDSINVPFNYEYYESLSDTRFSYDGYEYSIDFTRRGATDNNNYIGFYDFQGQKGQNGFDAPQYFNFDFGTIKNRNNQLFEFSTYFNAGDAYSECTITNFSLDTLSGRVVFDFEALVDPNDMGYDTRQDYSTPGVVKGHADIVAYKSKNNNNDF